ncbi:XTP/dITP diphosphatase [Chloroflexota bacterium]
MSRLLLATTNKGKIAEYRYLFHGLSFELVTPADEDILVEVEEGEASMEENASHKARVYANLSGLITVADDSGLEVDALGGEPGIRSARYAGEHASDRDRIEYLLDKIKEVPREKRTARFVCVIAVATSQGVVATCRGECEGIITFEAKGDHGFGYDPIFYLPELGKTMAELPSEMKNQISHRARAGEKVYHILEQLEKKVLP